MTTKSQAPDPRSRQMGQVPLAHLTHVTLFPGQALPLTCPIFFCLSILLHGCGPSCSWWPVPHSHCLPDLAWFEHIPTWILVLNFFWFLPWLLLIIPGFLHCGLVSPVPPGHSAGVTQAADAGGAELRNRWALSLTTGSIPSFWVSLLSSLPFLSYLLSYPVAG